MIAATHVCIAQEAVNNAMHHSRADEILIDLAVEAIGRTFSSRSATTAWDSRGMATMAIRNGAADHGSSRGHDLVAIWASSEHQRATRS